ncbi:tRNA (guanosine(37)-N1)-methyltransferase TrmD [Acetomicrobium flavidum]|uniref:tRNA (guanosine(37)-N1)-methyltransferase TrmD n=1 Tax=Acetomicrobium flavidum TaxID=49896 RepID=UPI003460CA9D
MGVVRFSIVTAFPEYFDAFLNTSIVGRAVKEGKIEIDIVNLRDYAINSYGQIDDYSYGGGGMVIRPEPLYNALKSIKSEKSFVVYTSPQGVVFNQDMVEALAAKDHVILICGHYEGIDERFAEKCVDLEISIGDYVLTGGELPAMVIVDAVSRLVPGVVGRGEAVLEDSFYRGMLDHPHYTRPSVWCGLEVPEELVSGDHEKTARWRRRQAVVRTLKRRPDLLARANIRPYLSQGVYVMLVHHPVLNKDGKTVTSAVTGLDLHDISRSCMTYGINKFIVVTPLKSQQEMVCKIVNHWEKASEGLNPMRSEALSLLKAFDSIEDCLAWIEKKEKKKPLTVATTAKKRAGALPVFELKRILLERDLPVCILFGTSWGLADEVFSGVDVVLSPILGGKGDYNHLSVRSAVAILLDRLFGWR